MDFWDPVLEASVSIEEGTPRFICTLQTGYQTKTVSIYLDEKSTRKATRIKFIGNLSPSVERDITAVVDRIVDDLFDMFGASGYLEWDPSLSARCNEIWTIRMLRRDLKKRGLPNTLSRECVNGILDEIFVVEVVLGA